MVMANYFGTSYVTDAYVMAITIPTIIFGGVLTAISTSFIPAFSNTVENSGMEEGNRFTSQVINIMVILSLISAVFGIVFSDVIVKIFASGFHGETARLTSFFVKITFCYIFFSSISGLLESFLQYKGSFLPPIVTGYLLSGCTIVMIVICAYTNHYYLAYGMLAGHGLRFLIMSLVAKRRKFGYRLTLQLNDRVKNIFIMAFPVFIGSSMLQINNFVDKTLASGLKEGSVSALNYAGLLNAMIMAMTITIMTTIIYPKLTKAYSLKDTDQFNFMLEKGFNIVIIVGLPCSLGAMYYSNQVVQIVYERGAFDSVATAMTGSAFLFYIAGLTFNSLNELLTRAYYSMHNMKTPMLCASVNVLLNITLNLILIRPMAHNGLALSTSIAGLCNFLLLYYGLKKKYPDIRILKSKRKLGKVMVASLIAVGGSALSYHFIILPMASILYMRFVQLFLAVLVAIVIYYIMLKILKIEEIDFVKQMIKRK
jgi:putative peptidoglycan lipid II flippase